MNRRQKHTQRRELSLINEIASRRLVHRIDICFAGKKYYGKSTLAARFRDIDQGPYEEFFTANKENKYVIRINLDHRQNVRKRGEAVLSIYIEPPPRRRQRFPPIWLCAKLISLVVFCFDVNDENTFFDTRERIFMYYRLLHENMPAYIVVGNKIDVRDDPKRVRSKNVVPTEFAKCKVKEWNATHYFECSAWENNGVNILLDFILNLVLQIQPKVY